MQFFQDAHPVSADGLDAEMHQFRNLAYGISGRDQAHHPVALVGRCLDNTGDLGNKPFRQTLRDIGMNRIVRASDIRIALRLRQAKETATIRSAGDRDFDRMVFRRIPQAEENSRPRTALACRRSLCTPLSVVSSAARSGDFMEQPWLRSSANSRSPETARWSIKLPDTVPPGPHDVVIIVSEETTYKMSSDSNAEELMRFAGTIQSFSRIDGLEYQRHIRAEWE